MKTRMMICCRGWLIASLALLMTCAVSLGAPRERDVWYACVADCPSQKLYPAIVSTTRTYVERDDD
jgi:hypothetical protein